MGNIPPTHLKKYPPTPHTRIHKDHPIEHVIGDVQSSVQTRRMKTSYSKKGFLSAIYEGKTHQDLHTCLFVCFLSQEEPKRVQQNKKGIFISQDKYVHEILRKFNYSDVKSASTPTDLEKPLVQDADATDVDEHLIDP
ncbi:hypothetical protein Tco_0435098 [Tanacetum coccineum]